jgi:hypothetical protein
MNANQTAESGWLRRLHEILFSLNIGFAIMLTLSTIVYKGANGPRGLALHIFYPACSYLVDAAVSINRFLGVHRRGSGAGFEIVFLASMIVPAIMVLALLRLFERTAAAHWILCSLAGFTSVLFVPACWFYSLQSTWYGGEFLPFWRSPGASVVEIEVSLVCIFFILSRHWSIPMWCRVLALLFHCAWWIRFMWPPALLPLWSPRLFFFVFPCSGLAWLLYTREVTQTAQATMLLPKKCDSHT